MMRALSPVLWSLQVAALVCGVAACPRDPGAKREQPVAVVGDVVIDDRRTLAVLAQRGVARVAGDAERAVVIAQVVEQLVDEELLLRGAAAAGVTVDDEAIEREVRARGEGYGAGGLQDVLTAEQLTISAFRESIRRRLVQDAFLRTKFAALPAVTDADVAERYERDYASKPTPPQVRVRQVLLRTAEEARHVLGEVQTRKITVEGAAQKYSIGLEKDAGGDLGWFAQGEMPKVFDVCFVLEPGQVSEVIASEFGFHILQVIDRRPERVEPLAAVRERIASEIVAERQSTELARVVAELRKSTPVTVDEGLVSALAARLPPPPATPSLAPEEGSHAKALDSHDDGIDPIPPLPR